LDDLKTNTMISLVSEGNQRAFDCFYNLYYHKVFHVAYYYIKDVESCREVVTNVFFSVWKSRRALVEVVNMDSYLYIVAKNQAKSFLSQQSKNSSETVSLSETDIPLEISDNESTDNELILKEMEENLTKIVATLPERCRNIFLMSREDSMDFRQIASSLDISESTVRVQLKIAVDKIIAQLKLIYPNLSLSLALLLLFC
jgi:RNA polymerase sigma-70 factor (family 1)